MRLMRATFIMFSLSDKQTGFKAGMGVCMAKINFSVETNKGSMVTS